MAMGQGLKRARYPEAPRKVAMLFNDKRPGIIARQFCQLWGAVILCLVCGVASAGAWLITPRLGVSEILTDNINLSHENKKKEYITRLVPGVAIKGEGNKLNMDVDYGLEHLVYEKDSSRDSSYSQLRAHASADLVKNSLSFNAYSTIRQQIVDPENRIVLDNLNPATRSNVLTYSMGPTLKNHFGAYATSELDFRFGRVIYSNTDQLANSRITNINLGVSSGRRFGILEWNIKYNNSLTSRGPGDRTKFESLTGDLNARVTRRLRFLMRGGILNDDVQATRGINNGSFLSAGLIWQPSTYISVDATAGRNNQDANIAINPSRRTSFQAGYTNRDVGTNPGTRWSLSLLHNTRRTSWNIGYSEDTTNLQSLEFTGAQALTPDSIGGTQVNPIAIVFTQSDNDFVRKRLNFGVSLTSAKSTLNINSSFERRDFTQNSDEDKIVSTNASWEWQLNPRNSSVTSAGLLNRHFTLDNLDDTYWYAGFSLNRQLQRKLTASINLRHIERNVTANINAYQENRLVVGINKQF